MRLTGIGYHGGYDMVRRFIEPLRGQATISFEAFRAGRARPTGASAGHIWSRSVVNLFVMSMGYSRRMFARDIRPVIATAIQDRVLHHSPTISIKDNSYRLKEKVKAGLIRYPENEQL